jgi:MGT family glycosyltransferase
MPVVAFFAMRQEGHFESLLPLVSGLARRGLAAYVFTHSDFRERVEVAGGTFVDLFASYPLEDADDESLPAPCRHVTFAGRYAEEISQDLEEIRPSLVIYDAHAVIGRVVGVSLGIPYVSVCPAHNVGPAEELPRLLETLPETSISAACERAVETLKARYGLDDASPFAFASWLSPHLNVYGEPPAYLTETQREALEPVAFNGCLPDVEEIESMRGADGPAYFDASETRLKVYVSFGTVVWRYFPSQALDGVRALSDSFATMEDVTATISVGGADLADEDLDAQRHPNVSVQRYVDQWRILAEADAFVTHNGLKSTHEAIFNRVPMISYPFFWDQPALAERCRSLDTAIPLTGSPLAPLRAEDPQAALVELSSREESLGRGLERAREWELELIADRGSVLDRIVALIPA